MQFLQKHLGQTVEGIISARKEPECPPAADAGQTAKHVVIDVVARPSQSQRIVVIIIDADRVYENF